jgi:uncharacterized membrane protein YgaE (UPF0421/DUF939 family)
MIAALVYMMVNAVLFGCAVTIVLAIPVLAAQANTLVPAVVVTSLILALPVSWFLAPRLRARYWRDRPASGAL